MLWDNWGDERGCDKGHWHTHIRGLPWGLPEVVGMVQQVHCSRRRLLRRGLEFHECTINKSAHTKKVWKLIVCTLYIYIYISSSSSSHTDFMDFPDSLSPSIPIIHCSWEVFQTTSCVAVYIYIYIYIYTNLYIFYDNMKYDNNNKRIETKN